MSSNAFAATVDLQLKPSVRALMFVFAGHVLAVALIFLAQPPKTCALALAVAFFCSWLYLRRHSAFGYGRRALTRITVHADGGWSLESARAGREEAKLLSAAPVKPALIVLNFRTAAGARRSRALLGDEAPPELLRRLRARLLAEPTASAKPDQ